MINIQNKNRTLKIGKVHKRCSQIYSKDLNRFSINFSFLFWSRGTCNWISLTISRFCCLFYIIPSKSKVLTCVQRANAWCLEFLNVRGVSRYLTGLIHFAFYWHKLLSHGKYSSYSLAFFTFFFLFSIKNVIYKTAIVMFL